jgi:hypothetical protein
MQIERSQIKGEEGSLTGSLQIVLKLVQYDPFTFKRHDICLKDFCQKDFCPNDFCPNDFYPNDFCPNNFCPNGFCPNDFCPNDFCLKMDETSQCFHMFSWLFFWSENATVLCKMAFNGEA